jgi:hypothetical protein
LPGDPSYFASTLPAAKQALQPRTKTYMTTPTLASECFNFSSLDPASIERAFIAHLRRFAQQNRDVDWLTAPAVIAAVSGDADDEGLFRAAMEDLLDSGVIVVERLPDGGNRLVATTRAAS